MSLQNRKKIVRLLGVGFDAEDGHVRITNGEKYDVLLGSDESHEYISALIARIEGELEMRGLKLDELDPQDLGEIVRSLS